MSDRSLEQFVVDETPGLLRTAYLLTGDRRRAEDLLQAALIAAHRHWDRAAAPADQTASVRRDLVSAFTSWQQRVHLGDLLATSPLLAGTRGLPGFAAQPAAPVHRDELTAALLQLAPRQRAALVLRHGEQLSETATAAALGAPVEEVAALSRLGLLRIARLLDGPAADGDALVPRLRAALAGLAADVAAAPGVTYGGVLDGVRSRRRHRAGLVALALFLALVVLLVVLTV